MHASPNTEAGLIIALTHALPDPDCPLGRRAMRLADRLAHGASRAAHLEAAALTAALLDATDPGVALGDEPDCLDLTWDDL